MLTKLIFTNWKNKPSRPLLTVVTFTIGLSLLIIFLGLITGLENYFRGSVTASGNLNQINVQTKGRKLSLSPTNLFNQSAISTDQLDKIRALPTVQSVYAQNTIKGISSLQVGLFGRWLQTDTLLFGAEYDEIKESGVKPEVWANRAEPFPVIISSKILDIYNLSFAKVNNLPELTPEILLGTDIDILLNQSTFYPDSKLTPKVFHAKIVGFSPKAKLIGITLPAATITEINQKFLDQQEVDYLDLTVLVKNFKDLDRTRQEIEKMGLETSTVTESLDRLNSYFLTVNLVMSILFFLILLMAGLMLASTLIAKIAEKQKEIAILKALGLTSKRIAKLFLIEGALLAAASAILASLIVIPLSLLANFCFAQYFNTIINKPNPLISLSLFNFFITFSVALFTALLFSYLPAQKAAKLDPLPLLSK